ncbi:MAG TPA: NAAT family transporter [Candidatus Competibacteraceae bacterium]|nr:MAG: NAAT family transporter [Candidatus Competibacteraceae bacterium]HOB60658.1 NAAT family transporter [Candidatus Competibacteraceae bacterium]HQA24888.1 NAAT family transporter [Candidatus Competibacteraceae bacterium]HQD56065.1 NAAT family transporter [Candidatus Competibacteraceae bacterium]
MDITFAIKFFGALFAIMNPLAGLPIFLGMTEDVGSAVQRKIALKMTFYIVVIGVVAALAGTQVLKFFGISIHDLQVAGGLVVLGLAFSMLHGSPSSMHHGTEQEQSDFSDSDSLAFYPLAFPVMMGPGSLTTMILFAGQTKGLENWIGYFVAFGVVVLMVAVLFALGSRLSKYLTSSARVIMSRVMGLILAAIAIEMIFDGAKALLPGLAGSA